MIVKMKKLTLLVSEKERETFLTELRKAGAVHIKNVKEPVSHDINFVEDRIANIEKTISILLPYKKNEEDKDRAGKTEILPEDTGRIAELHEDREELVALISDLEEKIEWFDAWSRFDPEDIKTFREKGLHVKLYKVVKGEFKKLKNRKNAFLLKKEKGHEYIALASFDENETLEFDEIIPPEKSPDRIKKEIETIKGRTKRIDEIFTEKAQDVGVLNTCKDWLKKEHQFLNAKHSMQEEGKFAVFQGYCPEKTVPKITSLADKEGFGYLVEEPDDPEETPTLITNPKPIRVIRPVFQFMNTVPGYNEFDISFIFLVFFSIFFAMLIGDAGYGILFVLVTFFARRKFRKAPYEPFFLMYLLGGATILWGAATGTWFGAEQIARLPFLSNLVVKKINSFGPDNQNLIIYICFLIGAIQLTFAHIMKAIRVINSFKALAQVGWALIVWGMFFAAGKFVIARPFPPFAGWFLAGGMLLVILFSSAGKGWLKGMGSTLVELPLSVIGSFSDVVSYIRLFAVGYASVVLSSTFNNMALSEGINSVLAGLGAAVILCLGHTLNIILGMMAVVVHGIRLNMLEFSGHLGMQWSGKNYDPFREEQIKT